MTVPSDVDGFGAAIARRLESTLGDGLVGVWFVGSIALGGFVPGQSDVDIIAVCQDPIGEDAKAAIADDLVDAATSSACPARGLELTLYRRAIVGTPPVGADFELNANGGPRMERSVHLDAEAEPWFWYALDRAIAFRSGRAIVGPLPHEVFVEVPRQSLLAAMVASMRWHRQHEGATLYSVLNAARAWRFAIDDVLGSKLEGADWARARWSRHDVIDVAVELRHGRPATLDKADVDALLSHVERELMSALETDVPR